MKKLTSTLILIIISIDLSAHGSNAYEAFHLHADGTLGLLMILSAFILWNLKSIKEKN
jgi:hypothetical protein